MERKFIFDKVRLGTGKENQIAIQGFCSEEFLADLKVKVDFNDKGKSSSLDYTYITSGLPALKRIEIQDVEISKMITILIDMPKEVSNSAKLAVSYNDGADDRKIYSCQGKLLNKLLKQLNLCLDAVIVNGENVILRGWAVDFGQIDFSVRKGSKNGESLEDVEVTLANRADVISNYPEKSNSDSKIGFTVKFKKIDDKLYFSAVSGDKKHVQTIMGLKQEGDFRALRKIKRDAMKTIFTLRNMGLKVTCQKINNRIKSKVLSKPKEYDKWIKERLPKEDELAQQRKKEFAYKPKFSILVPLYETDEKFLKELINSVKSQTYSNWELCFSDGSKDSKRLEEIVGDYTKKDDRIKFIAEQKGPLGISDNTNQALTIATGEYIVLGDHDDLFTPDALYECVKVLNKEKCDVIYTDEDKIDAKGKLYFEPNFKPDFNIDLLRSNNYICHMFVASKKLVDEIGMFNHAFDGAQDYDFIFRCIENADKVKHIPKVLYHWRSHKGSTAENPEAKLYAFEAGKRAIQAHYDRVGLKAEVESIAEYGFYKTNYEIIGEPLISIVIPNKDHIDDLKKCMDSIDNLSDYRNYEYVVVENNSTEDSTFDYYKEIEKRDNVQVVYWDKEFNYSAINNYGVKYANGEYILLLNNDTEIINPDCLRQMLGYCQREDVGIVGARLYYEDGAIQHAGVIVGYGGIAGHAFVGYYEEDGLYMSRTKVACDYSAVTAACLMIKKSIFEQVGGLDEDFKVAFNDVDFCMKVRAIDKLVVYNANAKLRHYESKSRGLEDTPEKKERFRGEIERFVKKWPDIIRDGDPYYNVNLALDRADFSVRS